MDSSVPTSLRTACLRAAAALAALAAVCAAQAADLESRYGVLQALPAGTSAFSLVFEGRKLATIEAAQVSLLRVNPGGPQDHVVIESWKPALHCHKSYALLTIQPNGTTALSPPFGECTELQAASYLKDGVRIRLRAAEPPDARQPKMSSYIWSFGQLSRLE